MSHMQQKLIKVAEMHATFAVAREEGDVAVFVPIAFKNHFEIELVTNMHELLTLLGY